MISSSINRISKPSASVHIPAQLAKLDQDAWGNHSLPKFVQLARLGAGRLIGHKEWQSLSEDEKDYVIRSWEANGVAHHINTEGVFTLLSATADSDPAAYMIDLGEYQFGVEDCRLRHSDMVRITVINVDSAKNARRIAKQFLEDVKRFGLSIR